MLNCWETLGIEPTNNKKEIRLAYAAKSKLYHPEEDEQAFVTLNQAYQAALKYVSAGTAHKSDDLTQAELLDEEKHTDLFNRNHQAAELDAAKKLDQIDEINHQSEEARERSDQTKPNSQEASLLDKLEQDEMQKINVSQQTGALKRMIDIFEAAKKSGKVPRAKAWEELFLSEEFLREQYSDAFGDGMLQYLSDWSMAGNYNIHALPSHFLTELSIAYGLAPESVYQRNNPKFGINANGSFHARECVAALWNMQSRRAFSPAPALYKTENLVRLRSFADYIRLKSFNRNHKLNIKNQSKWRSILSCGCANYLYELNGKDRREIDEETRSECLIWLYTFWLRTEKVPDCVLEYMYKEYNLKNVEHSSGKKLYGPLKQEILKQYPQIERELFSVDGKKQAMSNWHRELMKIVSDNHSDYDQGIYEETEKTKERIEALFARSEWEKFQYEQELFDKIYSQICGRRVIPVTLANRLIAFYSQKGVFEQEDKADKIVASLVQSIGFNNRIQEIDGVKRFVFQDTSVSDINNKNRNFWHYYLMTGYGARKADVGAAANSSDYSLGSEAYLSAYIEQMYYPSLLWRTLFTGWQKKQQSNPPFYEFALPDQTTLRVEFHLHYCQYFLDGEPVSQPVYSFTQLQSFNINCEKTEQFFFLLAIVSIEKEEWAKARELIEKRLSDLPFHPITIPLIARLLAEGFEPLEQTSNYEGSRQFYQRSAPFDVSSAPKELAVMQSGPEKSAIQAIYYTEREDYCLRAVVLERAVLLQHKKKFGWHALSIDGFFEKDRVENMDLTQKRELAQKLIRDLQKPTPVSLAVFSLEGMDNNEKAEKIMEALMLYERYCGNDKLTQSYCALRYGPNKDRERVFYLALRPFAFQAKTHNLSFMSISQFRLWELDRKVKEPHQIIGNFGWGDVYTPKEGFEPMPFALGESGVYYYYDAIRMRRADNLTALLAQIVDFANVTEVECYQGCLSVSRLSNKLEYCFGEQDFKRSIFQKTMTVPDLFTKFTKAQMIRAFADWLDKLLAPEALTLRLPYFVFERAQKNIYVLKLYNVPEFVNAWNYDLRYEQQYQLTPDSRELVWKIWDSEDISNAISDEFAEILEQYMEHGAYGWKLKSCLAIDAAYADKKGNAPTYWRLYKNISGLYQAIKEKTAMTAYAILLDKNKTPTIFDSKFGGLPYWDASKEYPTDSMGKKLMLIAQFNLTQTPMPELVRGQGMLQFFGDGEAIFNRGFGSFDNQDQYRVIYHETIDESVTKEELERLGIFDSTANQTHTPISREHAVNIEKKTAYMGLDDYRFRKMFKAVLEEAFQLQFQKVRHPFETFLNEEEREHLEMELSNASHWLLGYPEFAVKDPRKRKKTFRAYDRLLFQFDIHYLEDDYFSDTNSCGIANFFISSEDLEKGDFSKVMYNWECCED